MSEPIVAPGWRVVGASVTGTSHLRQGLACQDRCCWQSLPGGVLVVAVADGCGSAKHAEWGAEVATQSVLQHATQVLGQALPASADEWHGLLRDLFRDARNAVLLQAEVLQSGSRQLATTLLVALASPDVLAVGQIGDGAVIARRGTDQYEAVTRPEPQEYINETDFLTSESYMDETRLQVQPSPVSGLALLTDGLQMLALRMPQGEPHVPFFAPLLRLLENEPITDAQVRAFLQSPAVSQRAADDLTLVLAVPQPAACGLANEDAAQQSGR